MMQLVEKVNLNLPNKFGGQALWMKFSLEIFRSSGFTPRSFIWHHQPTRRNAKAQMLGLALVLIQTRAISAIVSMLYYVINVCTMQVLLSLTFFDSFLG